MCIVCGRLHMAQCLNRRRCGAWGVEAVRLVATLGASQAGVEDDGNLLGLEADDLAASLDTVHALTREVRSPAQLRAVRRRAFCCD